jgi:hypothetical protein
MATAWIIEILQLQVLTLQPPVQNSALKYQLTTAKLVANLLHLSSFLFTGSQITTGSSRALNYDRRFFGQSVLVSSTHLGLTTTLLLLSDSCGFVHVGRSLWGGNGSVVYNCCWSSPAQSFLGHESLGTPGWRGPGPHIYIPQEQGGPVIPPGTGFPFSRLYDPQGYGGGIRTRLHAVYSTPLELLLIRPWGGLLLKRRLTLSCIVLGVFSDPLPSKGRPTVTRVDSRENVLTESLPLNEQLFWFRYSDARASCHNIQSLKVAKHIPMSESIKLREKAIRKLPQVVKLLYFIRYVLGSSFGRHTNYPRL